LFAAQVGASKVIAVDGSSKMAAVATQVLNLLDVLRYISEHGLLFS